MSLPQTQDVRINVSNGLLLYYHPYSYYTHKVIMALYEKNLRFESYLIDLMKGDQYSSWFLQLNPRGEVPVLQDEGKIIPDSTRIIDYLEDNFSNGDTPRLIPMDQGPEVRQKVTHFRALIDKLPASIITYGSFFNTESVGRPKLPFIAPVRRMMINGERTSSQRLRDHAAKNPQFKDILLQKAELAERKRGALMDKEGFQKVLDEVDSVLTEVESELSQHSGDKCNWWLCSDRFTIADISLTILVERLNQLGLEKRFWSDDKRPYLEDYYNRVKQRDSYKKTIPMLYVHIRMFLNTKAPLFIGIGVVATLAVIVGGYFLVKKLQE